MAEDIQVSKKQMLILFGGVLAMSFLGIVAGSYFVQQKTARERISNLLLKKGDVFPKFSFESLESGQVGSEKLLAGKKSVLIFFASDCGHCVKTIEKWDSVYAGISSHYQVFGVSYETPEKIRSYKSSNGIQIPFYRDTNGKFTGQYKIQSYPTLVGIDEKGRIVFVEVGNWPQKSAGDYLKLL